MARKESPPSDEDGRQEGREEGDEEMFVSGVVEDHGEDVWMGNGKWLMCHLKELKLMYTSSLSDRGQELSRSHE